MNKKKTNLSYLINEYDLAISAEFGEILENIVSEHLAQKAETIEHSSKLKKLKKYLDKNFDIEHLAVLVILQNKAVQHMFLSRWILRKLDEAIETKSKVDYCSSIIKCFDKVIIHDDIIVTLNKYLHQQKKDYGTYLINMFDMLLGEGFFENMNSEKYLYAFVNLWKISKEIYNCNGQEKNITLSNINKFSNVLKKCSYINEEKKLNCLNGMNLTYMDFTNQDLSETMLYNIDFRFSKFCSANLDSIYLSGSDLSGADFSFAFMECAHMEDCKCVSTSFKNAHMLSSVVSGSDFTNANLENANFMECDADRIKVKGLKINDKTAVNDTDFRYVNWEDVDISGLSITDNQISHFWEVVNYTRNTILYDAKFRKLDNSEIQNVIFKELKASALQYLEKTILFKETCRIFISYASEEKQQYALPIVNEIKQKYSNSDKYSIWIDDENLTIGDQLRKAIESEIRRCKLVILIYSDNYARKGWTRYEIYRILQEVRERNLNVIVLNTSKVSDYLDLFSELCEKICQDNYLNISEADDFLSAIVERVGIID